MAASDFSKLLFPSENQIVIVDGETDQERSQIRAIPKLPMTFFIDYKGKADNPPPLTLIINPESLNVSNSHKVNVDFARGGNIVEDWGSFQETLSLSGRSGGYYIARPTVGFSGLNRYEWTRSASFQNLFSLFMLFKNNGAVYEKVVNPPREASSNNILIRDQQKRIEYQNRRTGRLSEFEQNRIYLLGDLWLSYDSVLYKGAFDDFKFEENSDQQYSLNYSFNFTVQDKHEDDRRNFSRYNQRNNVLEDTSRLRGGVTETSRTQSSNTTTTGNATSPSGGFGTTTTASENSVRTNNALVTEDSRIYLNPFNSSTTQAVTSGNIATKTTIDYLGWANTQKGLATDDLDFSNTEDAFKKYGSNIYNIKNQGKNDLITATQVILTKNGKSPGEVTSKGAEYSEFGLSIYDTKKRLV